MSAVKQLYMDDWEREGQQKIAEILSLRDLRKIYKKRGRILNTREEKHQLAEKLIIEHGRDLLSNKDIRYCLGKRYGLKKEEVPPSWIPGSKAAEKFANIIEFPKEFYGDREISNLLDYEFVQKTIPYELQDFQKEVIEKILEKLGTSENRFIVSLPTGSGKTTITISSVLKHIINSPNKSIIWFAHTEELCEQAYNSFKKSIDNMSQKFDAYIFRFWKNHANKNIKNLFEISDNDDSPCIMVCTPEKFRNLMLESEKLRDFIKHKTGIVIIDEAHRSGAATYQEIIEKISQENSSTAFIGVTATPYRMEYNNSFPELETKKLTSIFDNNLILPNKTLGNDLTEIKQKLIEKGYLSNPIKVVVDTGEKIDITDKIQHYQDLSVDISITEDRKMQKLVDKQSRRKKILKAIKKENFDDNSRVIYFGPTKADVKEMCYLLRKEGYAANYILSGRKNSTRRKIIKDFSSGKIQFLCNCEILTTGFDEPKVSHLIMARPTISQVLYDQMIGRGLRGEKFGGTKDCRILSCEDIHFPGGYDSFYEFWKKPTSDWSNKTLFTRTIIYLSYVDIHFDKREYDYIKKAYQERFQEEISNEQIQKELSTLYDWINDYFKNLDRISANMTDEEKTNLLLVCKTIIPIDGYIDEKEEELFDRIKFYLQK